MLLSILLNALRGAAPGLTLYFSTSAFATPAQAPSEASAASVYSVGVPLMLSAVAAGAMFEDGLSQERRGGWPRRRGIARAVLLRAAARAALTRADVSFDDHPFGERMRGRIATTAVDAMFAWLMDTGYGVRQIDVRLTRP